MQLKPITYVSGELVVLEASPANLVLFPLVGMSISGGGVPAISATGSGATFTADFSGTATADGLPTMIRLDAAHSANPTVDLGDGPIPIRDAGGVTGLVEGALTPNMFYPCVVFTTHVQMVAAF